VNLAIFDIDGTLTESVAVDEVCFVQAFRDVLGIKRINTDWLEYNFQTDSGLTLEICRNHLGRDPSAAEIRRLQDRFVELLCAAVEEAGRPIRQIPGAAPFLHWLRAHARWHVAIATGGWAVSARFKLASAGLPLDGLPWASADDALDRVDILRTAIRRAGKHYAQDTFGKVIYVGDGVWDVRAAKALGIGFLGLATDNKAGRLVKEGASCVLPDFLDPVRVSECLEEVARNPIREGGMSVTIRPETAADLDAIRHVNCLAFGQEDEAWLVRVLRDGGYLRLSLVAEKDGQVVGHILFNDLSIITEAGIVPALALAPMAVLPECQRQGIGSALVRKGLEECRRQGHKIVVVVGHSHFYPRFGFSSKLASALASPFGGGDSWMAVELVPGALNGVAGRVQYPPPFGALV
jgi:putative acetyltransferase